jgi:hypothetical protein
MGTAVAPDAGTGKRAHSPAPDYKRAGRTVTALWHPNPLNDLPALSPASRRARVETRWRTRVDRMEAPLCDIPTKRHELRRLRPTPARYQRRGKDLRECRIAPASAILRRHNIHRYPRGISQWQQSGSSAFTAWTGTM